MDFYKSILENRELIKIFYALAIILICIFITIKTNRLFKLSLHQGIRYFRNAFFFYGIAFFIRYFLGFILVDRANIIDPLFEFFMIMAGFFLLYSLVWKNFEKKTTHYVTSLFHEKVLIFYLMAFILVIIDILWQNYFVLFLSQILIFSVMIVLSLRNYLNSKGRFLKFYLLAMILTFLAWVINAIASRFLEWSPIFVYTLNIIVFLMFLYGVLREGS